ncbi:hypothetical protein ACFYQ5_02900 [Streptomyces sp. NPDC005794]|uniref:hypothetical protein n=1 Tax=Streptomyces sp. NPDC005794 TaxID=3364733 RepID=UPI0036843393
MAAARKGELVPRPPKKIEYEIRFATADAQKGWRDLVATIRNSMTETWDFLTRTPLSTTPTNYRLKGELGVIERGGATHERWQHKPTAKGTARNLVLRSRAHGLPGAGAHEPPERDEVASHIVGERASEWDGRCVTATAGDFDFTRGWRGLGKGRLDLPITPRMGSLREAASPA